MSNAEFNKSFDDSVINIVKAATFLLLRRSKNSYKKLIDNHINTKYRCKFTKLFSLTIV